MASSMRARSLPEVGQQGYAGGAGVDGDCDMVLRPQLRGQQRERALEQRQLGRRLHRSRHVDQQHQVARGQRGRRDRRRAQPDAHELALRGPRTPADLDRQREGLARRRHRIAVVEVVDQLLDAHGVGRRQPAFAQEPADIGVRRRVDVDGEGGERRRGHRAHGGLLDDAVTLRRREARHQARVGGARARYSRGFRRRGRRGHVRSCGRLGRGRRRGSRKVGDLAGRVPDVALDAGRAGGRAEDYRRRKCHRQGFRVPLCRSFRAQVAARRLRPPPRRQVAEAATPRLRRVPGETTDGRAQRVGRHRIRLTMGTRAQRGNAHRDSADASGNAA